MTSQLVYQRIRNRIIEMLEWIVECESTPPELGMNELVNAWEDWVPIPLMEHYFNGPVFTEEEENLIREVSFQMNAFCDKTPKTIRDDIASIRLPEWSKVIVASKLTHVVMLQRGRMPEDFELPL